MIALYPRVSTQEQADNGHSIDEQTERMRKYCDAMGWDDVKLYTDAGFSGANMNRPALQALIKDVEAGKVERVLVYKLDRLSRSQLDTLYLIEKVFLANDCDFVSMCENFDTSTPFGRAMVGILAVFAQLEREQIKERVAMGKLARAKLGKFHGSAQVPIGYDYENGELVTNDFERAQIVEIYESYAAGMSPPRIADKLNDAGMIHKGGRWLPYTIRQILDRKTYLGYLQYNGEWYKGTHEAFISDELFERVQALRRQRAEEHERHNRRSGKANSYLGGFLYCARCGAKYIRTMYYSNDKTKKYVHYTCNNRAQKTRYYCGEKCLNRTWRKDDLETIIFGEVKKLTLEPDDSHAHAGTRGRTRAEAIASELAGIERKVERLVDLYADERVPRSTLEKRLHALEEQREKLTGELAEIEREEQEKTTREAVAPLVRVFGEIIERGSLDEVRAILGALIDKIELDGDDVTIFWKFAVDSRGEI